MNVRSIFGRRGTGPIVTYRLAPHQARVEPIGESGRAEAEARCAIVRAQNTASPRSRSRAHECRAPRAIEGARRYDHHRLVLGVQAHRVPDAAHVPLEAIEALVPLRLVE